MKVLHINSRYTGGGAEQFAFNFALKNEAYLLTKQPNTSSHSFLISARQGSLGKTLGLIDKITWKLFKASLFTDLGVSKNIHSTYQFLSKLEAYQEAQIIHLHNIHGDFFDFVSLKEIAKEKPIVWTLHDMWAITGGEGYVFQNNNYQKGEAITPYGKYYPLSNSLIERRPIYLETKKSVYAEIDNLTFVPVSYWLEKCLRKAYVFNNQLPIQTIQNGVDLSVFSNQDKRDWEAPRLLFFNSKNVFKGTGLFKKIATQIKGDFELFTVGEAIGVEYEKVIEPISQREKMSELFNQIDILVFPSEAENFSLMVIEAMACGVMVIGSNTGGIPEQIDEKCGVLFEVSNAEGLLQAINKTLQTGLEEARKKGGNASEKVKKSFNIQDMYSKYFQLYEKVLKDFNAVK